jgi:hypothetical protein
MAINIINTDSVQSFDYMIFPEQIGIDESYLQQQFSNITNIASDISTRFIETAKNLYEKANNSDLIRSAKAAVMAAKNILSPNSVYHLRDVEQVMSCQGVNQRFIMANPEIRRLYHDQLCDGFSDTYVDLEPGKIGQDHYDYRRVTTGIVFETEDGWKVNNYYEDLKEGDKELTVIEKTNCLLNWDTIADALSQKIDPTNVYGGKIGG